MDRLAGPLFWLLWLAAVIVIGVGSAGLVQALDHRPTGSARPELTWAADEAIRPGLEAAGERLRELSTEVEDLGTLGRGALAALAARDFDRLDRLIADGSILVIRIHDQTLATRGRLVALPGLAGPSADLRISAANRDRQVRMLEALDTTADLALEWARVTDAAGTAARLSYLLEQHDELVVEAIQEGIAGRLASAITQVGLATQALDQAEALRDRLRNTTDTSTLDEWLRRNGDYDVALGKLYTASAASPDRVTPEIRAAIEEEKRAREQLPEDNTALIIVMAEVGRGGLNQAVISIEDARGRLAAAILALEPEPGVHSSP